MPAQVQIQSIQSIAQMIYVTFTIVLSGNYPTGGDPLNFTASGTLPATQDPAFIGMVAAIEGANLLNCDVWSQGGAQVAGANTVAYTVVLTRAGSPSICNPATGAKLKCGVLNTYGTEHAAAGYEAAYTGDSVGGMAVFSKLL